MSLTALRLRGEFTSTSGRRAAFLRRRRTGKPHYTALRLEGLLDDGTYASPVAAGGHVYVTGVRDHGRHQRAMSSRS